MAEHIPPPYAAEDNRWIVKDDVVIARMMSAYDFPSRSKEQDERLDEIVIPATIAFIVRCVNAHADLLAACEEAFRAINAHAVEPMPVGVYSRVTRLLGDAIAKAKT